ncbi:glycosyltransferase family 2 protein [Formosa sp. L2A11]|uniref:glycosyltransferase n=1 Tax=Formosa sp. L2A11 TaxID=2686363 RepID=UPI00131D88F3|nr:glycosyltransferase family 2 protein [Formosa sp. L2A11]
MKSTTLNISQFNISEAIFGDFETLNESVFKNESITERRISFTSAIVFISTFMLMIGGAFGVYAFYMEFKDILLNPIYNPAIYGIFIFVIGWLAFNGGLFLFRFYLYLKHKPVETIGDDLLPHTTVIVSAQNMGKHVYETLMNLVKSDYPEEKLQILAIDNASNDDTWSWMHEAKNDFGERVTIIQHAENMSQHSVLQHGFDIGTGDVFVTVNNTAQITEDTLRTVVSRFIENGERKVESKGVRVLSKEKETISRTDKDQSNLVLSFAKRALSQRYVKSTYSYVSKKGYNASLKVFKRLDVALLHIEKELKQNLGFSA